MRFVAVPFFHLMKTFSKEQFVRLWNTKWAFGGVIAVLAWLLALVLSTQFNTLELKSYDSRFVIRGHQDTSQDNIVVVAIDEQSIASLKTWPFPRIYFARLIQNLNRAGARIIVVDVEFTEASSSDRHDLALAGAIKRAGNVILAGEIVTENLADRGIINRYIVKPYQLFLRNTGARWGLINLDEDPDGFYRRYLLFQSHGGKAYLPLSLHAYLKLRFGTDGTSRIMPDDNGYFRIRDLRVPKVDYNSMLINFRGPARSFPTYSFASVIDDSEFNIGMEEDVNHFDILNADGVFKDKIVYVGASAEVLQDNKLSPFFKYADSQKKLPGVEVHANALSTLLRGDFIKTQSRWSVALIVLLLSVATMVVTKWLKPFRGMFAVLGMILFFLVLAVFFFIDKRVWVEVVAPSFAIVLSYVGNVVHQTLTEQRERIRIKKSWQQYMSKDVIDAMLNAGDLPTFGGERREVTVLFSDIRGFTSFSEKHTSAEVVQRLNEYLTEMVDVIFAHSGTLDKFVGDEIMAVYGAPHYFKDHAERACITAVEMVNRLNALKRQWAARKQDHFDIGIGINSGKVILGNLGSSQLFDYTVIGDDVNLGARLEGANKQYGTTIIISEMTYRMVRHTAAARELDLVRVKGKKKPVKIFELLAMSPLSQVEQKLKIDIYTEALTYYKSQKWYQALKEFKRILKQFPDDGPTRVYIKRCLDFIEFPPPENWDGVYEFTTK